MLIRAYSQVKNIETKKRGCVFKTTLSVEDMVLNVVLTMIEAVFSWKSRKSSANDDFIGLLKRSDIGYKSRPSCN